MGPPHLQQLVSNAYASIAGSRSARVEAHHENAEAGPVSVSRQAETQTLTVLLQLHAQQLPLQVSITFTPALCSRDTRRRTSII